MSVTRRAQGGTITFFCPGCECGHGIPVAGTHAWGWNGSMDAPTFTPSILIQYRGEVPAVCHSFVTDGKIQFLNDCTHALKGQTVALEDFDA